jgi:hypothetical protein
LRLGSFRQAVTDCHWVRFAATIEIGFVRGTEHRVANSPAGTGSENPWRPESVP